jgi:hypothetical protein
VNDEFRLRAIPAKAQDHEIAAQATASRMSEAKRDAVVAVLLAIQRRGDNVITGWTVKDLTTAEAIGELLIGLNE